MMITSNDFRITNQWFLFKQPDSTDAPWCETMIPINATPNQQAMILAATLKQDIYTTAENMGITLADNGGKIPADSDSQYGY